MSFRFIGKAFSIELHKYLNSEHENIFVIKIVDIVSAMEGDGGSNISE